MTRQRPSTRAASEANPLGVDVFAAGNVVNGTDGVPNAVAGRIRADQDRADSDQKMLVGRAAELGPAIGPENLRTLPLAYRVITEGSDSLPGQRDGDSLIVIGIFGGSAVPARYQDDGVRRFGVRQVECPRNVMFGLAFE